MAVSQKLTTLTQASNTPATSLLYIVVDPTGTPTSNSITIKGLFESNATSNLVVNGSLIVSGIAIANAIVVNYKTTPANATNVPAGFSNNTIWSDGSFIYVITNTNQIKRVAIATW